MKTKVNLRTADNSVGGDKNGKGKRLVPEKKEKNMKQSLFKEIEEDEDIDFLARDEDSLEDYYDDDEDDDYDDDEDNDEDD